MIATSEAISTTSAALTASALQLGLFVSGDQRVSEKSAARLVGYAPGHLRALRQEGKGPAHYVIGIDGCRLSYRIKDLAVWIESGREST